MNPICFARKVQNSAQMRMMSWGTGIPCKESGYLIHPQFLYVFVHSFAWCHESWSPGHKEHGAGPAQGGPAAPGVVAGQVGNTALLPIHGAPPGVQIPDDFNISTPGFAWSRDLPICSVTHLPCQTPAMALSDFTGRVFRTEHTAGQFLCSSLAFLDPAGPSHKPSSHFSPALVKSGAKVTQCCSTGLVSLDSRKMTTDKARSQYLQCSVVLLQPAGVGWNSVLPSTFNNIHEGFSIPLPE